MFEINYKHQTQSSLAAVFPIILILLAKPAQAALTETLQPLIGHPGSNLHITGSGFIPFETVDVVFGITLSATVIAGTDGKLETDIKVPANAPPGSRKVKLTGKQSGLSVYKLFTVRTNWKMFGFTPAHSRFNRYENTLKPANVQRLVHAWQTSDVSHIKAAPAVVNGVAYIVGSDDYQNFSSSHLFAIDAVDGSLKWKTALATNNENAFSSPAAADGMVFVGEYGRVSAFNGADGSLKWRHQFVNFYDTVRSSPVVAEGVVYIGGWGLTALNAADGKIKWSILLANNYDVVSSPAVANGVAYIIGSYGHLSAYNTVDGSLKWEANTDYNIDNQRDGINSSPAVAGGIVYVGSPGGNLYAFRADNGKLKWKVPLGSANWKITSSPAVANGVVYIGSTDGYLYAVNSADGSLKWKVPVGSNELSSPTVANGLVYIGSWGLYALDAETGVQKWWNMLDGYGTSSSPTVADGIIYIGAYNGFHAFHLSTP